MLAPAVRAAIRNVAAWPATTRADATATAGHARRASSPSRRSRAAALRSLAHRPTAGRRCAASATPAAAATSASATSGMAARTGDGADEEHGHGEDELHDLPGRALPRHGAQPEADVARHARG